ncbi:unnamed protein product [Cladocopium goreaui]|uniref:Electron transfer flavoprotein beta subunit lysine methyltransferase (ETFB lysine methyltransferase ) (ETFB-KMT) (Protein N-lysine methyltransferase METTL20) n=1 Tax=Cladocopium goreaui TaxID=2562237 RepID=A0A9P1GF79_9DINO|nr:unnamed protein product [Cladocopium goreaui]
MSRSRSRSPHSALESYESWLTARGVWWDDRLRLQHLGASGWGLTCSKRIEKGEKVIRVPRAAALTSSTAVDGQSAEELLQPLEDLAKFDETRDSQLPLVISFLLADASWRPKLRVTPSRLELPWSWPSPALEGTELQLVVAAKRRRLAWELQRLETVMPGRITLDQYTSACAVIMSRIQPWWGGSLVPFVDQANHSKEPHLEFRLSKGQVEGRALRVIEPGEVFQSYGNLSTADSLYRYGFASAATRASEIRVSFEDVVTVTLSDLAAVDNVFLARAQKLKTLEFLDESPWDGVEELGLELSLSRRPKLAAGGIKGLRRLWVLCRCMALEEAQWQAALTGPKPREALGALGVAAEPGVGWEPGASALQLSLRSLEVRSRRLGSLEDEVRRYDAAVAAQVEGIQLGLQRLRVVEAKLLQRVVSDWLAMFVESCKSSRVLQDKTRPAMKMLELFLQPFLFWELGSLDFNCLMSKVKNFVILSIVLEDAREHGKASSDPSWAQVWPCCAALAQHVATHPELVRRRRVFELGAGLGVPSIAAALAGARDVLLLDREPLALHCAASTAAVHNLPVASVNDESAADNAVRAAVYDWAEPQNFNVRAEVVLASEVLYDCREAQDVAVAALRLMGGGQGRVLIADPRSSAVIVAG